MGSHVAYAPRNHVTDAIMKHAASRDALRARGKRPKRKGAVKPSKRSARIEPTLSLAATPILASQPAIRHAGAFRSSRDFFLVRPASFIKNILQGALAGLMTFFSAIQFSGGSTIVPTGDFASELPASVSTALSGLPAGAMTGVIGVIGAAILFMNAGRGLGRTLGLAAFIVLATAYANGANGEDLVPYLESIYHKIKGFLPLLAGIGL